MTLRICLPLPGIILTVLILLGSSDARGEHTGGAFGEGLRLVSTARTIGMSDAVVALADGVSAVSMNPAGLLDVSLTTLHLTHSFFVQGLAEDYFAYSQRLSGSSAVGLGIHGMYDSSTARTLEDETGAYAGEIGSFPVGFVVGGFGGALDLGCWRLRRFSFRPIAGACLRGVWQQVDNAQWMALSADVGVKAQLGMGLTFGGVLQNLGAAQGGFHLPLQWTIGLGWQGDRILGSYDGLLLEADAHAAIDRGSLFRACVEYRARIDRVIVAVRGGWKQENQVPGVPGFSTGAGFRWITARIPWGLDYAFVPWGEFGNQHSVALTVGLTAAGKEEQAVRKEAVERRIPIVFYPLMGEVARCEVAILEPTELSADLLDTNGGFILTIYEKRAVGEGTVEVFWDGRLPTGALAEFDKIYRLRIQLGESTSYRDILPIKEQ